MKYRKNQITLQIRVSAQRAVFILNRLYGAGVLTKDQYYHKLAQVDMAAAEYEKKKRSPI